MIKKILLSVSLGMGFLALPATMFAWGMCVIVENADSGNSTDYVSWDGSNWSTISKKTKMSCVPQTSGTVWVAIGASDFVCPSSSNDSGFSVNFNSTMDEGSNPWLTVFNQGDGAILFDGNGNRDPQQPTYYASVPNFPCAFGPKP